MKNCSSGIGAKSRFLDSNFFHPTWQENAKRTVCRHLVLLVAHLIQKANFAATCTSLGEAALTTCPKWASLFTSPSTAAAP